MTYKSDNGRYGSRFDCQTEAVAEIILDDSQTVLPPYRGEPDGEAALASLTADVESSHL